MKTISFNTGRKYTAQGQRITATLHDDQTVTFWDHDRHIDGQFQLEPGQAFNARLVLACYDQYKYTSNGRSLKDGMMRDGCNAAYLDLSMHD
jgi:hypothetical protein